MKILPHEVNDFGGVTIKVDGVSMDYEKFTLGLAHSIEVWKASDYKLVWLRISLEQSEIIPVVAGLGFVFHHAENDYVLMVCRLTKEAFIPKYSTHYVGAGGVVINDDGMLLVVAEQRGRSGPSRSYKLPGGHLDDAEHIQQGVIREVFEETGVTTKFLSLVCFRHQHNYRYGKSDIYFVCRLRPITHDINKQDDEIAECLWMPIEKYLTSDSVGEFNKVVVRASIHNEGLTPQSIKDYKDPEFVEILL